MERQMEKRFEPRFSPKDSDRIEKIKRIAYHLWLNRRENNISGSAEQDYFQAERIYDSHKTRKLQSLRSLCVWTVTYLAAELPEPDYLNATMAAVAFDALEEELI
jgi:hypothetical protein